MSEKFVTVVLGEDAHDALTRLEQDGMDGEIVLLDAPVGYTPKQVAHWIAAYRTNEYLFAPDTPAPLLSFVRATARKLGDKIGAFEGRKVDGGTEYIFFRR